MVNDMKTKTIKKYKEFLLNMKFKLLLIPVFLLLSFVPVVAYDYEQTLIGESGFTSTLVNPRLTLYVDFEPNLWVTSGLAQAALEVQEGIWYDSYTYDQYYRCNGWNICNDTYWNSGDPYASLLNYTNPFLEDTCADLRTCWVDNTNTGAVDDNIAWIRTNILGKSISGINYPVLDGGTGTRLVGDKYTNGGQLYFFRIYNDTVDGDYDILIQRGTVVDYWDNASLIYTYTDNGVNPAAFCGSPSVVTQDQTEFHMKLGRCGISVGVYNSILVFEADDGTLIMTARLGHYSINGGWGHAQYGSTVSVFTHEDDYELGHYSLYFDQYAFHTMNAVHAHSFTYTGLVSTNQTDFTAYTSEYVETDSYSTSFTGTHNFVDDNWDLLTKAPGKFTGIVYKSEQGNAGKSNLEFFPKTTLDETYRSVAFPACDDRGSGWSNWYFTSPSGTELNWTRQCKNNVPFVVRQDVPWSLNNLEVGRCLYEGEPGCRVSGTGGGAGAGGGIDYNRLDCCEIGINPTDYDPTEGRYYYISWSGNNASGTESMNLNTYPKTWYLWQKFDCASSEDCISREYGLIWNPVWIFPFAWAEEPNPYDRRGWDYKFTFLPPEVIAYGIGELEIAKIDGTILTAGDYLPCDEQWILRIRGSPNYNYFVKILKSNVYGDIHMPPQGEPVVVEQLYITSDSTGNATRTLSPYCGVGDYFLVYLYDTFENRLDQSLITFGTVKLGEIELEANGTAIDKNVGDTIWTRIPVSEEGELLWFKIIDTDIVGKIGEDQAIIGFGHTISETATTINNATWYYAWANFTITEVNLFGGYKVVFTHDDISKEAYGFINDIAARVVNFTAWDRYYQTYLGNDTNCEQPFWLVCQAGGPEQPMIIKVYDSEGDKVFHVRYKTGLDDRVRLKVNDPDLVIPDEVQDRILGWNLTDNYDINDILHRYGSSNDLWLMEADNYTFSCRAERSKNETMSFDARTTCDYDIVQNFQCLDRGTYCGAIGNPIADLMQWVSQGGKILECCPGLECVYQYSGLGVSYGSCIPARDEEGNPTQCFIDYEPCIRDSDCCESSNLEETEGQVLTCYDMPTSLGLGIPNKQCMTFGQYLQTPGGLQMWLATGFAAIVENLRVSIGFVLVIIAIILIYALLVRVE